MARIEPEKGLIYSSPAIHARRRRILEETRKMIAEQGLTGFSMDEIGKRAGVAKRTLYNAFQTKERMVAIAIQDYFYKYISRLPYTSEQGTLQRSIERMIFVIQRNQQIRNYISAIMSIYFSADANSDIWTAMHSMSVNAHQQWIDTLRSKRQLQPWVDAAQLPHDIVHLQYAIINEWCQGRIEDDRIVAHLITTFLTFMAGATRGAARKEVEATLNEIRQGNITLKPASIGAPYEAGPVKLHAVV